MKKLLEFSLVATLALSALNASDITQMFEEGRVSGELRSVYAGYNQEKAGENDTYATAVGGHIKYELAELNGFSGAMAFAVSHDVGLATGDGAKQNSELSSSDGEYTVLNEMYVNYKNDDFNFRAGRQIIDTPLADSDDIRMIVNTFEAYIATYEISNFSFMLGNLQDWQGTDAGLDDEWVKTGEDGTWFGGVTYADDMIEASAWYYNITKLTNAAYFDIALNYEIDSDVSIVGAVQYLNESEISNSGTKASIYGLSAELSAYGVGLSVAYNKSEKKTGKASFSGFGGGTLFTNMDTMILDGIAKNRDASAIVAGVSYEIGDLTLSYAYGDFDGKKGGIDDLGVNTNENAHIVEQNFGFEYSVIVDKLNISGIYAIEEDRESAAKTDYDWDRFQLMIAYSF
jgi:hypothetical protein